MRTSLILILIGGLLVLLDFTISSGGGRGIDVLNDTIGWVLILLSLPSLLKQPGPASFVPRMQIVLVLSIMALIGSVLAQIGVQAGVLMALLIFLLTLGGTILFCLAMRDLVGSHGLTRSEGAWHRSLVMVAVIWGAAALLGAVMAIANDGSAYVQVSGPSAVPLLLLVLAVILTPAIFLIVAIAKTLGELKSA
jgi:hypothetical protein